MQNFSHFLNETVALTFEYHDELNPLLWEHNKMRERIRHRLLQIGQMWSDFARIPSEAIKDIVMTGGNCNYNYTPYSDIDVHIMIDPNKMPISADYRDEWLYDKKLLWSLKHKHLTVMGYPIELYAQDYNQPVSNQGFFSLQKNKWLHKPKYERGIDFKNDQDLIRKVEEYAEMIDRVLNEPGDHVAEIVKLKEKLWLMRCAGIQRAGEFSQENLVYKELRNMGLLNKLNDYVQHKQDISLSLY